MHIDLEIPRREKGAENHATMPSVGASRTAAAMLDHARAVLLVSPVVLCGSYGGAVLFAPTAAPDPWPSAGCGQPLGNAPVPVGVPADMTVKVDDPNLFNQYRDYTLYLPQNYSIM